MQGSRFMASLSFSFLYTGASGTLNFSVLLPF